MQRLKPALAALLSTAVLVVTPAAYAAEATKPAAQQPIAGISMTPAIQDKVLGPADKTVTFTVELFNDTKQPVTMAISTTDFSSLNQTGGVAFLGGNASSVTSEHGLSSFLVLDTPLATIAPNATKTVTAKVNNVEKLAVGGHYAAILARAITPSVNTSGNKVSINQVLSSLVFLQTAGQGTKTLKLLEPQIDKVSFSLPRSVNLVFKATGNTQTVPRGIVDVLRGDKAAQHGLINQGSSMILPGSVRLLETPLTGNQHPWWPGIYHMRVQYRYDGSLGINTYQTAFLYVNLPALLVMLCIAFAVIYGSLRSRKYWSKKPTPKKQVTKTIRRVVVVRDESAEANIVAVTVPILEPVVVPEPEPIVEPVVVEVAEKPVKKATPKPQAKPEPKPYPNIVLKAPKKPRVAKKVTKTPKKAPAKTATKPAKKTTPKATPKTTKKPAKK